MSDKTIAALLPSRNPEVAQRMKERIAKMKTSTITKTEKEKNEKKPSHKTTVNVVINDKPQRPKRENKKSENVKNFIIGRRAQAKRERESRAKSSSDARRRKKEPGITELRKRIKNITDKNVELDKKEEQRKRQALREYVKEHPIQQKPPNIHPLIAPTFPSESNHNQPINEFLTEKALLEHKPDSVYRQLKSDFNTPHVVKYLDPSMIMLLKGYLIRRNH